MYEKYEGLLDESKDPQEFMLRALNKMVDAIVAHEMCHVQEVRVNGMVSIPVRELANYFMTAAYSDTAFTFMTMIERNELVVGSIPSLDKELRDMGAECFLLKEEYLREWAFDLTDALFGNYFEIDRHEDLFPDRALDTIEDVQTSAFIADEKIELVESLLSNPTLRLLEEKK
jgi:hypothetical protein